MSATPTNWTEYTNNVWRAGAFLGYVLASGLVVSARGQSLGTVMPDGMVVDAAMKPIGVFATAGEAHART